MTIREWIVKELDARCVFPDEAKAIIERNLAWNEGLARVIDNRAEGVHEAGLTTIWIAVASDAKKCLAEKNPQDFRLPLF